METQTQSRKGAVAGAPYAFNYWRDDSKSAWLDAAPEPEAAPFIGGVKYQYVQTVPNYYHPRDIHNDKYAPYSAQIECGRDYLVGRDCPMDKFLREHRSALTAWQKDAYQWAIRNAYYRLVFTLHGNDWQVYVRGDCVVFALPHQDAGGERHYVSNNGRSKILVNVD